MWWFFTSLTNNLTSGGGGESVWYEIPSDEVVWGEQVFVRGTENICGAIGQSVFISGGFKKLRQTIGHPGGESVGYEIPSDEVLRGEQVLVRGTEYICGATRQML